MPNKQNDFFLHSGLLRISFFAPYIRNWFFFLFEEFEIWQWCSSPKCWILACPVRICTQTLPSLRAIGCWNLNVLCIIFNRKVFTKKSTTKDWGGSLFSLKRLLNSRLAGCSSNFSRICIRKVLKRVHSDPELKMSYHNCVLISF